MTTLLFVSPTDNSESWRRELVKRMPDLEVRVWPDIGDPAAVTCALVWKPPPGVLASLPNLKVILSLGAGVEPMLADSTLPDVPLVRMVADGLTDDMAAYVVLQVLRWQRRVDDYTGQQRAGVWKRLGHRPASEVSIGILGLGVLGEAAARALLPLGFRVMGWSRSPKDIPGVETLHGDAGLTELAGRSDFLACLLPLTEGTRGILGERLFAALPPGAVVINAARGGHLVEADLLAALDSGHLGGASLDVFNEEPLPPGHPFWTHPKVHITPHVAGVTHPSRCSDHIVDAIRRAESGRPLLHVVDRTQGY